MSVETAVADDVEPDGELDDLTAYGACDLGGRVLQVSAATWLPDGSGGYSWADSSINASVGFEADGVS